MAIQFQLKLFVPQLELTILALFGRKIQLLPLGAPQSRPMIQEGSISLPSSISAESYLQAKAYYFMCVIHAMGHILYSTPMDAQGYKNRQLVMVSLIEDARVETLLINQYPGLKQQFKSCFVKPNSDSNDFDSIAYGVAYGILNSSYESSNYIVSKALNAFRSLSFNELNDAGLSLRLGLQLANDIGQMRISMNERTEFTIVDYRDDNQYLWQQVEPVLAEGTSSDGNENISDYDARSFKESFAEREVSALSETAPNEEGNLVFKEVPEHSDNELRNKASTLASLCYKEWDYKIARFKERWCSVDVFKPIDDQAKHTNLLDHLHAQLVFKLYKLISSYQQNRWKQKAQKEGDELDLEAVVNTLVDLRSGRIHSDPNLYLKIQSDHHQDIALLVLLDLSESMNQTYLDSEISILKNTEQSTLVLSSLLDKLDHSYAVHGFNSDGRHHINYYELKGFAEQGDVLSSRLPNLTAQYSTRLGAGVRHAYTEIAQRQETHKLILVITDGKPSDIDVYDENYLIEDAKVAVREVENKGIKTFCLALDTDGENDYTQQIFKPGHYGILKDPNKLTDTLVNLYLKIFKAFM
ncbi:nitric oxide reductase activation protein NorD [Hydrogenovibrio crunogenus]|uniref:Nitric oxide reductase activation protein NorD n=1 Tax=Hydrogenovibrio crunogenus TaxID=39765 RepID=A0A4P7NY44_9GAMM|nr:VWA domain-containing protein [Hydrogenovibrio crunogenus]QBZ82459.1 nitric oxide reductase activation protein NorD [Hydrogenovibrio crunogenus]